MIINLLDNTNSNFLNISKESLAIININDIDKLITINENTIFDSFILNSQSKIYINDNPLPITQIVS